MRKKLYKGAFINRLYTESETKVLWKSTTLFIVIKVKKHRRKYPWGLINDQHMNISQRLFKIVPNEE